MRTSRIVVTAIAVVLLAAQAQAGHFCDHCGCQRDCKKVCRLEVKKKDQKKTEYSCECEDFCVPGPSKRCGYMLDPHCDGHPQRKFIWQPKCAKVYTKKKLVKKEVTKEVPDYKWVVEKYCCVCGQYIKIEDGEKSEGSKAGGDKSGGDKKQGDDKGRSDKSGGNYSSHDQRWPWSLIARRAGTAEDELRVGDNPGYRWGEAPRDGAAEQSWPPVITGGDQRPAARFSWTNRDD